MPRPTRVSGRYPPRRLSGPVPSEVDPGNGRNPTPIIAIMVIVIGAGLLWWMMRGRPVQSSQSAPRGDPGQVATAPAPASVKNQPPRAELRLRIDPGMPNQLEYSANFSEDPDPKDADQLVYQLNFGDGVSVDTASGVHGYAKPGSYTVEATVTDPAGATGSMRRTVEIMPPDLTVTGQPLGTQVAGLHLQRIAVRMENFATLDPLWRDAEKLIAPVVGLDQRPRDEWYGLHFSGFIEIPQDGWWTLSLRSDDGGRLIVAGKTLINVDVHQGSTTQRTTVWVSAGLVPLEIFYYQGDSGADLNFEWTGPGRRQGVVPAEVFFHAPDAP